MRSVIDLAKMELDNKVDETVNLIEQKIIERLKFKDPVNTIDIGQTEIGVHNRKMFVRICEKVAEQCPEGINVVMDKTSRGGYDIIRVTVDYKDLF